LNLCLAILSSLIFLLYSASPSSDLPLAYDLLPFLFPHFLLFLRGSLPVYPNQAPGRKKRPPPSSRSSEPCSRRRTSSTGRRSAQSSAQSDHLISVWPSGTSSSFPIPVPLRYTVLCEVIHRRLRSSDKASWADNTRPVPSFSSPSRATFAGTPSRLRLRPTRAFERRGASRRTSSFSKGTSCILPQRQSVAPNSLCSCGLSPCSRLT
jgi:hypothetical protein